MGKLKQWWLGLEQAFIVNKYIFWLALYIFFFFVFPFLITEPIDFDVISSTIPGRPPE